MMAALIVLPLAIWLMIVDALYSPCTLSRPNEMLVIGESWVTAVIAPFILAAAYSSFLYAFLTRSINTTLPDFLNLINPASVAKLTDSADRLKTKMLDNADSRWHQLKELNEFIFIDIKMAWFFQCGGWELRLRLFSRCTVYYALL